MYNSQRCSLTYTTHYHNRIRSKYGPSSNLCQHPLITSHPGRSFSRGSVVYTIISFDCLRTPTILILTSTIICAGIYVVHINAGFRSAVGPVCACQSQTAGKRSVDEVIYTHRGDPSATGYTRTNIYRNLL